MLDVNHPDTRHIPIARGKERGREGITQSVYPNVTPFENVYPRLYSFPASPLTRCLVLALSPYHFEQTEATVSNDLYSLRFFDHSHFCPWTTVLDFLFQSPMIPAPHLFRHSLLLSIPR